MLQVLAVVSWCKRSELKYSHWALLTSVGFLCSFGVPSLTGAEWGQEGSAAPNPKHRHTGVHAPPGRASWGGKGDEEHPVCPRGPFWGWCLANHTVQVTDAVVERQRLQQHVSNKCSCCCYLKSSGRSRSQADKKRQKTNKEIEADSRQPCLVRRGKLCYWNPATAWCSGKLRAMGWLQGAARDW